MAEHGSSPQSRVLRVFLSSTFRDFMQERDRLVKQVFPELRRKARERGVEVVEVDLRWGITEEESRQGKVLPICLAEINRCRPYFVGMLGERYGWVPPDDADNRVVLADEAWVEEHLGRRSVTELEILHGVLNNPEMAGRAFFYFRDPAWSQAQTEPGFVCDSTEEAEKLADLKQRILASGFPVVRERDLPNPEALADRIGIDLWALIEEQFPELDQPDALEREERKHASYRRSRTELYEDGGSRGRKVSQLEQWIAAGEQRILITGESGSGKSALIANWIKSHQQSHPDDVVFAHHLGCSNDANALEPMLARMVQAASKLMADERSEPIKVPQDYWELVSTVTDALGKLSFWCKQQSRRWIWVLDGLDRLPEENQQALPWLPLQLFPQLHVVISALDSPARTILQEREYTTLTIGPLEEAEQKALIQATMRRYNKTLVPELVAKILEHEPARLPLFLRVVLDELRVCGRHETLAQQLDGYLKAQSVDALYAKVLKRLEGDVGREVVEKVMTALWASRAGLSETELLDMTGVAPLKWAPVDHGLEGSLSRNRKRIIFDHNYLRIAVQERYLPSREDRKVAHAVIAKSFEDQANWNTRHAEEIPWQLSRSGSYEDLVHHLLFQGNLAYIAQLIGPEEAAGYLLATRAHAQDIDELLKNECEANLRESVWEPDHAVDMYLMVISVLVIAGFYRQPLLDLCMRTVELSNEIYGPAHRKTIFASAKLAEAEFHLGNVREAHSLYRQVLVRMGGLLGHNHPDTLRAMEWVAVLSREYGEYKESLRLLDECILSYSSTGGTSSPTIARLIHQKAITMLYQGNSRDAEEQLRSCLRQQQFSLGDDHPETLSSLHEIGKLLIEESKHEQAAEILSLCLDKREEKLGGNHPDTVSVASSLGRLYVQMKLPEKADNLLERSFEAAFGLLGDSNPLSYDSYLSYGILYLHGDQDSLWRAMNAFLSSYEVYNKKLGASHPKTLAAVSLLGMASAKLGDTEKAMLCFDRCISAKNAKYPDMVSAAWEIADRLSIVGFHLEGEECLLRCLSAQERLLGADHPLTIRTVNSLASNMAFQKRYTEAAEQRTREVEWLRRTKGSIHIETLLAINNLAYYKRKAGHLRPAEALYTEFLVHGESLFSALDPEIGFALLGLAQTLELADKNEEALIIRKKYVKYRAALKENKKSDIRS